MGHGAGEVGDEDLGKRGELVRGKWGQQERQDPE